MQVTALTSFDHGGDRRRGDVFTVSDRTAERLAKKGLVQLAKPVAANPVRTVGTPSSASPAVPASPKQTSKPSGRGGKKAKADE